MGMGVATRRFVDSFDDGSSLRAALFREYDRRVAIPTGVGYARAYSKRGSPAPHPPTDHFQAGVVLGIASFGSDPCVYAQSTAPAVDPRGIHLHDFLG